MIKGKNVVVVMPAYNAAQTIEKTWREVLDQDIVDLIIVVDDASLDGTVELARHLVVFYNHSADASSINFRRSVRYGRLSGDRIRLPFRYLGFLTLVSFSNHTTRGASALIHRSRLDFDSNLALSEN